MRLILVRHGQTEANLNRKIQGQSNGVLNSTGQQQVEALAEGLKDFAIDVIFSSPLRRAEATATAIARHHNLGVKITPLVSEWDCGALDGITAEEFGKLLQESKLPLPLFRPEGGETLTEVRKRAADFLDELNAYYQGQTVLVCSHGDWLRALLSLLLEQDLAATSGIYFDNASYSILELADGRWQQVLMNQAPWKED